jgi:hypothetical protein
MIIIILEVKSAGYSSLLFPFEPIQIISCVWRSSFSTDPWRQNVKHASIDFYKKNGYLLPDRETIFSSFDHKFSGKNKNNNYKKKDFDDQDVLLKLFKEWISAKQKIT